MQMPMQPWDPSAPSAWAQHLGLVEVPLFAEPPRDVVGVLDHSALLLDGHSSSFCLHIVDDLRTPDYHQLLSWAWSANVRHTVTVDAATGWLETRRWDAVHGAVERLRVPERPAEAEALVSELSAARPPKGQSVIQHVLQAFRMVREALRPHNGLAAIRVFNLLLLLIDKNRQEEDHSELLGCASVNDLIELADPEAVRLSGADEIEAGPRSRPVGVVVDRLLRGEPRADLLLYPELLIRHAAGELYQEAHLIIEGGSQLTFAGLSEPTPPRGRPRGDVRYTPPELARFLSQQVAEETEQWAGAGSSEYVVLDPACGSGVFLQAALNELSVRGLDADVRLVGFDKSEIACSVARFCLEHAAAKSPIGDRVSVEILSGDAFQRQWPDADMILMNPPFIRWEDMDASERRVTRAELGDAFMRRPNLAMPFLLRATSSMKPGGALGAVLPSPLLETATGTAWREKLAHAADLTLIGRFEGYSYFQSSAVEPSFLVLAQSAIDETTDILLAGEGAESEGLRAYRLPEAVRQRSVDDRWEIGEVERRAFVAAGSWLPRSVVYLQLAEQLGDAGVPTVADLFDVQQGARTGANDVFIIASDEYELLPEGERRFFRPIASNSTIRRGRIWPGEWIFYPYTDSGPVLTTEEELRDQAEVYYERWLAPQKTGLLERADVDEDRWWLLTRERAWQRERKRKLVSTYFGLSGSFAFDDEGDTVVVQGHAWKWLGDAELEDDDPRPRFVDTPLPWAYLAFLNSPVFEHFLACFCPRQSGGQFNLSHNFIGKVFLPDLSDDIQVSSSVVEELAEFGQAIHAGDFPSREALVEAAANVYGVGDALDAVRLL